MAELTYDEQLARGPDMREGQNQARVLRAGEKVAKSGGRTMQAGGAVAAGGGLATQAGGKGLQVAGKGTKAAGQGMMRAGAALSSTGVGAIAGVPLAIAGAGTTALGAGVQVAGKGAEVAGKGVKKAGQKTYRAGRKVKGAGKEMGIAAALREGKASAVAEAALKKAAPPQLKAALAVADMLGIDTMKWLKRGVIISYIVTYGSIILAILLFVGFFFVILESFSDLFTNPIKSLETIFGK